MLQFSNVGALHAWQTFNTYYTIDNQHCYEVAKGLVTNYGKGGGATKREGGAPEVLSLRKGGGGKCFSHAEGGAQKV